MEVAATERLIVWDGEVFSVRVSIESGRVERSAPRERILGVPGGGDPRVGYDPPIARKAQNALAWYRDARTSIAVRWRSVTARCDDCMIAW